MRCLVISLISSACRRFLTLRNLCTIHCPTRVICYLLWCRHLRKWIFFTEYGEGSRYKIEEVIGKGSYGVVCSALDTHTGEKVAIKKINDIFEHVSDATRILREIKLLRLLRHPDIVEIKHILLPPSRREFRDIYVVFELMESDLHQVIKANDDLTPEHYQFFLYQLLRGLKYMHTANVFHRDLKSKNILANADCKLKICDFGLARVAFHDTPTAIFWTDYVATRWYRAPELCGSFFSKVTGLLSIFNLIKVVSGYFFIMNCRSPGTPSPEAISRIRNEKARRYLSSMRRKKPIPFMQKFPNADPRALSLLERMLAFEPKDRPSAEENHHFMSHAHCQALADPYFKNIAHVDREPSAQPVTKLEFEFERRRVTKEDIRELIYREILEYHPNMLREFLEGTESSGSCIQVVITRLFVQKCSVEWEQMLIILTDQAHLQRTEMSCSFMFSVQWIILKSSLHILKNIMPRDQQELHLRGNITHYHGAAARPGKAVSSVLQYSSSPTSAAEQYYEQRRVARYPGVAPNMSLLEARTHEGIRPARVSQEMMKGST
ncbi:hypothetical protein EJB05_50604 [Eragrostis curvula]|uniref:Protein kinase domain-containing protein n=1 Tax=Eragrostis curvula TaxID=38414 RepID=A0A5J9SXY2_9POAL|nr:hypothetical protein EJB05_50604 [Eragrostis curvula]